MNAKTLSLAVRVVKRFSAAFWQAKANGNDQSDSLGLDIWESAYFATKDILGSSKAPSCDVARRICREVFGWEPAYYKLRK